MTKDFGTPKVLHLQERDRDGNLHIVRYYREDTIDYFVMGVKKMLDGIRENSDKYDVGCKE